jgi:hypothetical protein
MFSLENLHQIGPFILIFIFSLYIIISAWRKNTRNDKPVLRKHLVTTTFVCSGCGKISRFQNVVYEGHFKNQELDDELPPGWSCIPNIFGKPCDYCFDCSNNKS